MNFDVDAQRDENQHVRARLVLDRVKGSTSIQERRASEVRQDDAAMKLQRKIRTLVLTSEESSKYKIRLHCKHLAERLLYESEIYRGTFRLLNQALILALMLIALSLSANSGQRLGILTNIRSTFELDSLVKIEQRGDFEERLKHIAAQTKDYFPLSSRRFDSKMKGDTELIGGLRTFSAPEILARTDVTCLPTLSFTVWVRVVPQFVKGYLVRKGSGVAGRGSELACWAFYLHSQRGPELHYGMHDDISGKQIEIGLESAHQQPFNVDTYSLMTMVINQTSVDFYQNVQHLGRRELPRPVTDCYNNGKGISVGDANMELGQLRLCARSEFELYSGDF